MKKPSKKTGKRAASAPSRARGRQPGKPADALLAAIRGAEHRELGGVKVDVVRVGTGRVKRLVYPPGFRWSTHMKSLVGTDLCMHAHIGFLARGRVQGTYADGCTFEIVAPQAVVIEPGHDAWVGGREAAVVIQFDAEGETASRFGLQPEHRHA
jgi:hypothetical protein